MSRQAPTPFVPDQFEQAQVLPLPPAPAAGVMLSEIIAQQDWHMPEAEGGTAPAPHGRSEGPGTAKPLDKIQKWRLSDLAEHVYDFLKQRGELAGETLDGFRRRVAIAACTRRISQASHGDYKLIQAEFLKLKNRPVAAARALAQAATTAESIALFKLRESLKLHGLTEAYAEGIAQRIYKRPLASLKHKEIWTVNYTVRNNGNAKTGKGSKANRFKSLRAKREAGK